METRNRESRQRGAGARCARWRTYALASTLLLPKGVSLSLAFVEPSRAFSNDTRPQRGLLANWGFCTSPMAPNALVCCGCVPRDSLRSVGLELHKVPVPALFNFSRRHPRCSPRTRDRAKRLSCCNHAEPHLQGTCRYPYKLHERACLSETESAGACWRQESRTASCFAANDISPGPVTLTH